VAESRIRNPDAMIVSRHLWSPARILFVCLAFAAWSPETKQHGGGNEKNDWLVSPVSAQVPASTSAPSPSPAGPPAPLRTPQRVVLGTVTVQRRTGPGGTPIGNSAAKEWRKRSPLAYLESAPAACRLPSTAAYTTVTAKFRAHRQSLPAFNQLAAQRIALPEKEIEYFTGEAKVPPHLRSQSA